MNEHPQRILAIDDEAFNLKLLTHDLQKNNYEVITASSGENAFDILQNDANFDVILLDRMMPGMNGIDLLAKIKVSPETKNIPIIMQTAAASPSEIQEGIDAGVYYYLTKPFEVNVLLAIIRSAIKDSSKTKKAIDKSNAIYDTFNLIETGKFNFRTLSDVSSLAYLISNFCYKPDDSLIGISELMINAVEHGNLGITFAEKTQMMLDNCLFEEITKRLKNPKFKDRIASLSFAKNQDFIEITIEDMGDGFDWKPFLEIDIKRATLPNGRGIAIAKMISFHSIEYIGKGNKVSCKIMANHPEE